MKSFNGNPGLRSRPTGTSKGHLITGVSARSLVAAFICFIVLVVLSFYSASSAAPSSELNTKTPRVSSPPLLARAPDARALINDTLWNRTANSYAAFFPQAGGSESVATFAVNSSGQCTTTSKSAFVLGEKVCARSSNTPLGPPIQRRFNWVNADGALASVTDVTTDPQINIIQLPTSSTARGSWLANLAGPDGSVRASAAFSVSDPTAPAADLTLNMANAQTVNADADLVFTIRVANRGPDTALAVQLTDATPANTTFVGTSQSSGPAFSCVMNNGTTTCSATSLAKGAEALLTITYHVAPGTLDDTIITNTINVASTTSELESGDNTFEGTATVDHVACALTCPGNITTNTDADQYYATVSYQVTNNGNCGNSVTSNPPSGSQFPVGSTVVTAGGPDGTACSFTVTVNDTQVPIISCPANVTTTESPAGSGSAIVNYPAPTVTDNDPQATATCDHPSGSSFPVGNTTVTCTATDRSGNSSQSCSFTVTVDSASGCSFTCPQDITVNNTPGECQAVVTYPDATSSQACAAGTVTYSQASGTAFPVGTTTVTATRSTGETCSFHVTVVDSEAPHITCPANITVDANAGSCDATVNPGTPTATDECPGVTVAGARADNGPLNGTYHVGTTTITWTATDAAGNTASCQQTVTVKDVTPPTISCPANVTQANDPGQCSAVVDPGAAAATDNCGIESVSGVRSDGQPIDAPYPVGTTTITWTATDQSGNQSSSCPQTVTVTDTQSPTVTAPADSSASADANCQAAVPDYAATSTASDNCGNPTVTQSPAAGTMVGQGAHTVTVTATDAAGHTGSDTVVFTVNDTTAPTITVPAGSSADANANCQAAVPDYAAASTASDNCDSTPTLTQSPAAGTMVGTGPHTVTVTATDDAGNHSSADVVFTVNDTTAPTVHAPADSSADADSSCRAAVPDYVTGSTASDNCSTPTVTQDPEAGTMVGPGAHTVTVTATDAAGNHSSDEVVFTVNDKTPPTVQAPADSSASADANCKAAVPDYASASTASDSCGTVTVTQSPAANTLVGLGPHTVTVTATDGSGNHSSDEVVFTVNDTTAPTVQAPADSSASADANCEAPVPNYAGSSNATDNCDTPTVTQSPAAGTKVGLGPHTVTVTATDAAGNHSSDDVVFTVNDTTAPAITCPANKTANSEPGTCAAHVSPGTATASDNCGSPTVTGSRSDGRPLTDTYPVGTTTITWTATDGSGNSSSCTQTITVNDTEKPTITLNGQTPSMWPPNHGYQTFQVTNFVTSVQDNCGGTISVGSVVITKVTSDEAENGNGSGNTLNDIVIASNCKSVQLRSEREGGGNGRVYTIFFSVRDAAGNIGTATAKVVVPHNPGETPVDSGPHYTVTSSCQ